MHPGRPAGSMGSVRLEPSFENNFARSDDQVPQFVRVDRVLGVPKQDFHGAHAPSVPSEGLRNALTVSIAFPVTIPPSDPPQESRPINRSLEVAVPNFQTRDDPS